MPCWTNALTGVMPTSVRMYKLPSWPVLVVLAFVLGGCDVSDPATEVALTKAPSDARAFFQPGIEGGVLYVYITAKGDIFIYRRDLDQYGWITLPQFRRFVAHAKSCGGFIQWRTAT